MERDSNSHAFHAVDRVSPVPSADRAGAAGEYSRHRHKAVSLLARRFPRFDEEERLELYHAVWATVLEKRGRGEQIENLEAYLMGGVDKLALKRVGRADARRRISLDPLGDEMSRVPDSVPSPEERVVLKDEMRRAREIVDDLDPREREVIKLRYDAGLTAAEIRTRLGLRERQYRRLIERGTRKVVERVAAAEAGARSRRQVSLFTACLSGAASDRQLAEARSLIETDPKARAVLRAMRRSARRTAIALPLPPLAGEGGRSIRELGTAAKHHAVSAYVRVSDPTPLSGARPGTLAVAVAGCVAVGGGTYCAVQGVPDPIKPALGIERSRRAVEVHVPRVDPPGQPAPVATPMRPPPATTPPAPAPSQPVAPPPPPGPREFFDNETRSRAAGAAQSPPAAQAGPAGEFAP